MTTTFLLSRKMSVVRDGRCQRDYRWLAVHRPQEGAAGPSTITRSRCRSRYCGDLVVLLPAVGNSVLKMRGLDSWQCEEFVAVK